MLPPDHTFVLPAWITDEMMAETRAVWEPLYGQALSDDDCIEILINTAGVLRILFGLRPPVGGAIKKGAA